MSKLKAFILVCTAAIACVLGYRGVGQSGAADTTSAGPIIVYGNWVSSAETVEAEASEADVIVRARVVKVNPARALSQDVPMAASPYEDGKFSNGSTTIVTPFTDTTMDVLNVYKGDVAKTITVMQTGGLLPATGKQPAMSRVLADDPLFIEGQEVILFLNDISGDALHAKDRSLYVAVNPAGRYDIAGSVVRSHAEFSQKMVAAATLADLEAQIKRATAK